MSKPYNKVTIPECSKTCSYISSPGRLSLLRTCCCDDNCERHVHNYYGPPTWSKQEHYETLKRNFDFIYQNN